MDKTFWPHSIRRFLISTLVAETVLRSFDGPILARTACQRSLVRFL